MIYKCYVAIEFLAEQNGDYLAVTYRAMIGLLHNMADEGIFMLMKII